MLQRGSENSQTSREDNGALNGGRREPGEESIERSSMAGKPNDDSTPPCGNSNNEIGGLADTTPKGVPPVAHVDFPVNSSVSVVSNKRPLATDAPWPPVADRAPTLLSNLISSEETKLLPAEKAQDDTAGSPLKAMAAETKESVTSTSIDTCSETPSHQSPPPPFGVKLYSSSRLFGGSFTASTPAPASPKFGSSPGSNPFTFGSSTAPTPFTFNVNSSSSSGFPGFATTSIGPTQLNSTGGYFSLGARGRKVKQRRGKRSPHSRQVPCTVRPTPEKETPSAALAENNKGETNVTGAESSPKGKDCKTPFAADANPASAASEQNGFRAASRSDIVTKLRKELESMNMEEEEDIERLISSTQALIDMNQEIWERCSLFMEEGHSRNSSKISFCRISFKSVEVVSSTVPARMPQDARKWSQIGIALRAKFVVEKTIKTLEFTATPCLDHRPCTIPEPPQALTDILSMPKLKIGQASELPDYKEYLSKAMWLSEDVSRPFLTILKEYVKRTQVALGGIDSWLLKSEGNKDLIRQTLYDEDDNASGAIPWALSSPDSSHKSSGMNLHQPIKLKTIHRYPFDGSLQMSFNLDSSLGKRTFKAWAKGFLVSAKRNVPAQKSK